MMMLDPNSERIAMEECRQKVLHAARMQQLYEQADMIERQQFGERLMALVADLMISGGQKLKARSTPAAAPYTVSTLNG